MGLSLDYIHGHVHYNWVMYKGSIDTSSEAGIVPVANVSFKWDLASDRCHSKQIIYMQLVETAAQNGIVLRNVPAMICGSSIVNLSSLTITTLTIITVPLHPEGALLWYQ